MMLLKSLFVDLTKPLRLVVVLNFIWATASAQFENDYRPAIIQDTCPSVVASAMKAKLKNDKAAIAEQQSQVKDLIKELYDKRYDFVVEQFNDDRFIVNDVLTSHLQSVLNTIYQANPSLPRETSVYAYRSNGVNAISFGEGTIALTLGLLARMETKGQLAFVLCHELAHYHRGHSETRAAEYARMSYDKDLRKKVKEISKSEYGKFSKYTQLMNSLSISITKHGREKEFEADSIALSFYMNTNFDLRAPIRTLEILDSADRSLFPEILPLPDIFNLPKYPFKEKWLNYTRSTTWYASQNENTHDSLQTHPSCQKRIAAMERQLKSVDQSTRKLVNSSNDATAQLAIRSRFEMAASSFHFKQYGQSLFQSLLLAEVYPNNAFLHGLIAENLYQLYHHQKNHELGKVLQLPDPRFEENYDRYLTFVHQLRLTELGSLAYHYSSEKAKRYSNNDYFLYTHWLCSSLDVSETDPQQIKSQYLSQFPNGRFAPQLKK